MIMVDNVTLFLIFVHVMSLFIPLHLIHQKKYPSFSKYTNISGLKNNFKRKVNIRFQAVSFYLALRMINTSKLCDNLKITVQCLYYKCQNIIDYGVKTRNLWLTKACINKLYKLIMYSNKIYIPPQFEWFNLNTHRFSPDFFLV